MESLPDALLGIILEAAGAQARAACMCTCRRLYEVARDPSIWTSLRIFHVTPDTSAFVRHVASHLRTLHIGPAPAESIMALLNETVPLFQQRGPRVPSSCLAQLGGVPRLRDLDVAFSGVTEPATLVMPWMPRLQRISIRQDRPHTLGFAFGNQMTYQALRQVHIEAVRCDLLASRAPQLSDVTLRSKSDPLRSLSVHSGYLQRVELDVLQRTDLPRLWRALGRANGIDTLIVHCDREYVYINRPIQARSLSILVSAAVEIVDFDSRAFARSHVEHLRVEAEPARPLAMFTLRFTGTRSVTGWLESMRRCSMTLQPGVSLEIEPDV
jgi:hypothetical protein